MMAACPHCANALRWKKELFEKHPEYSEIPFIMTDENLEPAYADTFDYYYVPTFFVDGVKVHEGVASYEIIEKIFQDAK